MQNTVLIIGNGFDLYHKLPTRYTDFLMLCDQWDEFLKIYNSYKNEEGKIIQEDVNAQEQFEVRLDSYGRLIAESFLDFGNHSICYDLANIEFLKNNLCNNAWVQYFRETDYKKDGWIDFEREMENVLKNIELYYSKLLPNLVGRIPNTILEKRISSIIRLFGKKAKEPFKNLNSGIVHVDDIGPEIIQKQKLALLDAMKEEMDILNRCIYIYLKEFVSRIKCTCYSKQVKDLKNVQLLSFNYTYTYNNVYKENSLREVHAVHGELSENNMVLGISDDAFESMDYAYFLKFFQRIQKRTGVFYKKWVIEPSYRTLEDIPAKVHIIGHSLDNTDKGILKDFFCNQYVEKIYIYYHSQGAYEAQVINLINMFNKDFVIEQTASGRIEFVELKPAVEVE